MTKDQHPLDQECLCDSNKGSHPKSRGIFRWMMWILVIGLSSFLILLAVLPRIASTDWAKETIILPLVSSRINGTISIQRLKLSWFGQQHIQGLDLKDTAGNTILRLEALVTDTSLWNLLYVEPRLGKIHIAGLDAVLEQEESGITNFHRAIVKRFALENEAISKERIVLSNLNARLILPTAQTPLFVILDGKTEHNGIVGNFDIEASIQGITLPSLWEMSSYSTVGLKITDKPDIKVKANIINFPVDVLDRLIALKNPKAQGMISEIIGDHLNLSLEQVTESEGLAFHLTIKSPNLHGDIQGIANATEFHLTQPGKMSLSLTPQLLQSFGGMASLLPSNPEDNQTAHAELILRDFRLPVFTLGEAPVNSVSPFIMEAEVTLDQIKLANNSSLRFVKGTLTTKEGNKNTQELFLNLHGDIAHFESVGQFNLKGEMKLGNFNGDLEEDHSIAMKMEIEGKQVPTLFFTQYIPNSEILQASLGKTLDFKTKLTSQGDQAKALLEMSSENIAFSSMEFNIQDRIYLTDTTTIHYQISPTLLSHFIPDQGVLNTRQQDIPLVLTIHQLSFPSPFQRSEQKLVSLFQPDKTIFNAEIATEKGFPLEISHMDSLYLNHLRLQIHGPSLANVQCVIAGDIDHAHVPSIISKTLGSQIHFHIHSLLSFKDNGLADISEVTANLNANQAIFHLSGNVEGKQTRQFRGSGWLSYQLTPAILSELGLARAKLPTLSYPANTKLVIDSLSFPLSIDFFSHLIMKGKLEIDQLAVQEKEGIPLASLHDITIPWMINTLNQQIDLRLSATTRHHEIESEGTLKANVSISDWVIREQLDIRNLKIKGHAELGELPIAVIETLIRKEYLADLFGSSLNVNVDADIDLESQDGGALTIGVNGSQFNLNAGLRVKKTITLKDSQQPVTVKWIMSPQRFAILRSLLKNPEEANDSRTELVLKEPAEFTLEIDHLNIPWLTTLSGDDFWVLQKNFGIMQAQFAGNASIDKLSLSDRVTSQSTIFRKFTATMSTEELSRSINLNLHAKGHNIEHAEKAEISVAAMIENGFTPDGKLNLEGTAITLDAKAKHAPIVLLCNFVCLGDQMLHQVDAILGNELDADIHARMQNMNGLVKVNLKGTNGQLNLDGQVQNGFLTLHKPLKAETHVTPKLSHSVLQEFMPLLSTAIGAEKPVTIEIDPSGFALPIKTWDITKVAIDKITIDLGKVYFSNEGQIGQILSILNYRQSDTNEHLTVWFTPLYANMHNGGVNVERMDMLAVNLYPVAIWGLVDFVNDKVNMKIGLSSLALRNAFGVKNLPEDYLLQLSLRGSTTDARIDKAKATTKISSLVAQSQGPQGILIGGILDLVGGNYKDKKPPMPTTYPFPWHIGSEDEAQSERESQKREESQVATPLVPLKAIEKGATELFKMLR